MRMRNVLLVTFAIVAVIASTPTAHARGRKSASTAPGTYKEWGPDIDEVTIKKSFHMSDYDRVVVVGFDTSSTKQPGRDEDSHDDVKTALSGFSSTLADALRKELKATAKVDHQSSAPRSSKTLIVRGKVDEIEPGSRAGRYWGGFGAGGAHTTITGEIVDASSGAVLLRFKQERHSGGTTKFGGGTDKQVMRDSIHALGEDVAHILDSF